MDGMPWSQVWVEVGEFPTEDGPKLRPAFGQSEIYNFKRGEFIFIQCMLWDVDIESMVNPTHMPTANSLTTYKGILNAQFLPRVGLEDNTNILLIDNLFLRLLFIFLPFPPLHWDSGD